MATLQRKRVENVDGNFYVDSSCIDCDTCRWMAADIFNRQESKSAVYHQPETEEEKQLAMQALLSCPTTSIGTVDKPIGIKQVQQTFPLQIEDSVFHCGYHSEASFGAASYFIQRPEGNILVDSPRFTPPLVKRIEELGGIKYMYLTHRDDVADHDKFQQRFNCQRILHQDDIQPDTQEVEIQLSGTDTVELTAEGGHRQFEHSLASQSVAEVPSVEAIGEGAPDGVLKDTPSDNAGSRKAPPLRREASPLGQGGEPVTPDLQIIAVPGHSKGHTVLLYQNQFLFSGDHLAWSPYLNQLYAFRRFCWYSWSEQIKSMEKLANYSFEWVLPGHGRRYHGSLTTTKQQMQQCIDWMKQQ